MSDIFREVDEDVRRQEMEAMARRYGPFAVGIVLIVVIGVFGYNFWQAQTEARQGRAGDQLIEGLELIGAGDAETALAEFQDLAASGPEGYRMLALFQEAAAQRELGDNAAALETYDEIANGSFDATYRNLARLYAGYTLLGMGGASFADLTDWVEPVAQGAGPWRFHANEVLGFAALQAGERDLAVEYLTRITDDGSAPTAIARRADEMLNVAQAGQTPSAGE